MWFLFWKLRAISHVAVSSGGSRPKKKKGFPYFPRHWTAGFIETSDRVPRLNVKTDLQRCLLAPSPGTATLRETTTAPGGWAGWRSTWRSPPLSSVSWSSPSPASFTSPPWELTVGIVECQVAQVRGWSSRLYTHKTTWNTAQRLYTTANCRLLCPGLQWSTC